MNTTTDIPWYRPTGADANLDAAYAKNPTRLFIEPYRNLGPVFRCRFFGGDQVAMGGADVNRFVWKHRELWDYYNTNRIFREQFSERYLNVLQDDEYAAKRRRINQGFKPGMLLSHTPAMTDVVFQEIEKLDGEPTDFRLFCMSLVIMMTSRVLLQEDLPPGMDRTMAISNKEMLKASSLGWKRWLWYLYPPRRSRRREIFGYLNDVLDRREKQAVERDDILSLVLAGHPEDAPPIPRYELVHDLSQLFMAGSTTSSMIIAWSLIECTRRPEWRESLQEELDRWDPSAFDSMTKYPKLRATTLEIERLRPGVPVFPRIARQDFEWEGRQIKQGESVLHLHTLCHFLEEHYDAPFEFRPERFIEDPSLPSRDVHGTYGGGQHVCAGINLARIAPVVVIATVFNHYDIEFDPFPSGSEIYDSVTAPGDVGMTARFRRKRALAA